jgi:hypothetical protein
MSELKGIGVLFVLAAALVLPAVALADPPSNDAFAAAEELTGRSIVVSGVNKDATKEDNEPAHDGKSGGVSVWYRWTAPADGHATLSTCGSGFDTLLAVYTGVSVDALAPVVANDDACGLQSSVSFDASKDVTYRIAVDGLQGATGAFTLGLRLPPPNDDFADALELAGNDGTISGTTEGASAEDGEPYALGNSVWYSWTAPSTGPATVETCGSSLDTILSVYTGADVSDLTYVRSSDDACGVSSRASFDATAGVRYGIAVESYGSGGEFLLTWNRNPGPPEAITYPTITGTAREGEILSGSSGEWTGAPSSFAYVWGRCDANYDSCDLISGATSQSYALTPADVGHYVYFVVTATNVAGSGQAYAETNSTVRPRGPANTYPPQIAGVARVGERLRASQGIWRGLMPIQFKYQWQTCDAGGSACQDLPSEFFDALDVTRGHVGKRLRVVVTGVNPDGSISAASALTDVVAAPPPPTTQPPVRRCVVPKVRGRSFKQAKAAIRRARCATGRVRKAFSPSVRRGRVIAQRPRAGTRLPRGSKVKLVISKGRKR